MPQTSVTVAILLTIVSIGVLIYLIHHAFTSIHAWQIIREISDELEESIDYLFAEKLGDLRSGHNQWWIGKIPTLVEQEDFIIQSTGSGYIRAIDYDPLMLIAKSKDMLLRVRKRPGKFVVQGSELVRAYLKGHGNQKLIKQINKAFILGRERSAFQDVEFSIKQLVEIAIRAISPAVNDPLTAIRCIDQLTAALCRLAEREFPYPYS